MQLLFGTVALELAMRIRWRFAKVVLGATGVGLFIGAAEEMHRSARDIFGYKSRR